MGKPLTITVKMVLDAKRQHPEMSDSEIEEVCNEWLQDMAHDRDLRGEPEDSECLQPEQFMSYHG